MDTEKFEIWFKDGRTEVVEGEDVIMDIIYDLENFDREDVDYIYKLDASGEHEKEIWNDWEGIIDEGCCKKSKKVAKALKEKLEPEDQYWVVVVDLDNGDSNEDGFDTYEEAKEFYESIKDDPEYDWDIQVQLYTPEGDLETYDKIGGIVEGEDSIAREYAREITKACLDALDKGEVADEDLKDAMSAGEWEVLYLFAEMHPEFKDKYSVVEIAFGDDDADEEVEKIIFDFCDELDRRYPEYAW